MTARSRTGDLLNPVEERELLLLEPRFPLPNRIMVWVLLITFGPAAVLYYFAYANLLTLGVLALVVAVGEHIWATRHNIGLELRA